VFTHFHPESKPAVGRVTPCAPLALVGRASPRAAVAGRVALRPPLWKWWPVVCRPVRHAL
jgi:hypothetical protein